jgi:hypothetical protein
MWSVRVCERCAGVEEKEEVVEKECIGKGFEICG